MLGIKLFKIFSSNGVPKKLEQSIKQIAKTKVRTDINTGSVYMERVFKGNLYKTETKVLNNGAKKTITKVGINKKIYTSFNCVCNYAKYSLTIFSIWIEAVPSPYGFWAFKRVFSFVEDNTFSLSAKILS